MVEKSSGINHITHFFVILQLIGMIEKKYSKFHNIQTIVTKLIIKVLEEKSRDQLKKYIPL